MNKTKIGLFVLIAILFYLLIDQNEFFKTPQSLSLTLVKPTVPIPPYYLFVGIFIFGIVLTIFLGLPGRIKQGKMIKSMNAEIQSKDSEIESYKQELAALKGVAPEEITLAQDVAVEEEVQQEVIDPQKT